jgi:hypothetical protein
MLHRKKALASRQEPIYVVHRSNAVLDRAVCFLGRFLPKLGGAKSAAFFFTDLRVGKPIAVRIFLGVANARVFRPPGYEPGLVPQVVSPDQPIRSWTSWVRAEIRLVICC